MRLEDMRVGWTGLSRAIALSIVVTSAFWIALGAWLFHAHVAADRIGKRSEAIASPGDAQSKPGGAVGGEADGLVGGLAGSSRQKRAPGRPLAIPVADVAPGQLVDTFTQARSEGARHHDAIDILAPEGTPVLAAAPGQVERLFLSGMGGNTIYVRSQDRRTIYYYAHLASYAPGVREGMTVRVGEPLGAVGHTGNADPAAPHLHFAVWQADPALGWSQQGLAVNPYPLLVTKSASAKPSQ